MTARLAPAASLKSACSAVLCCRRPSRSRTCTKGSERVFRVLVKLICSCQQQVFGSDCSLGHSQGKSAHSASSCHSHLGATIGGIQHISEALKCPAKAPCFNLHEIQKFAACRPTALLHLALKALRQSSWCKGSCKGCTGRTQQCSYSTWSFDEVTQLLQQTL